MRSQQRCVLYAALGSSRQLITGPSAAAAALSAAVVGNAVAGRGDEFVATSAALAVCVGIAALAAGLLRLGFIANFISEPVIKGFIIGLSLTIIAGQIPKLFGIEADAGNFFQRLWEFVSNIDQTDGLTLLVGAGSLGILLSLSRIAPAMPATLAVWSWRSGRPNCSTSAHTASRSSVRSTRDFRPLRSPTSRRTVTVASRLLRWG